VSLIPNSHLVQITRTAEGVAARTAVDDPRQLPLAQRMQRGAAAVAVTVLAGSQSSDPPQGVAHFGKFLRGIHAKPGGPKPKQLRVYGTPARVFSALVPSQR